MQVRWELPEQEWLEGAIPALFCLQCKPRSSDLVSKLPLALTSTAAPVASGQLCHLSAGAVQSAQSGTCRLAANFLQIGSDR
jgi:hypothetical protein